MKTKPKPPNSGQQTGSVDVSRITTESSKNRTGGDRFWGLLRRRQKWVLSPRGRIAALCLSLALFCAFIAGIHTFLAITEPIETQYLVVEGWIPDYALEESVKEFRSRPYRMIFTVGAEPLKISASQHEESLAVQAYNTIQRFGVSPEYLQAVPAPQQYRNRTFESALALRKWLEEKHVPIKSFNLVTLGPHARRSRLLFAKAFAGKVNVGIISIEDRSYDPKHWWKFSEGARAIIGEGIGYIYARFFFHPRGY